jgi:hypothetical protein
MDVELMSRPIPTTKYASCSFAMGSQNEARSRRRADARGRERVRGARYGRRWIEGAAVTIEANKALVRELFDA